MSLEKSAPVRPMVRADHDSDVTEPGAGVARGRRAIGTSTIAGRPVRPSAGPGMLDLRPFGIAGQGEHVDAAALALGASSMAPASEPKPRYGLRVMASAASGEPSVR